MASAVVAADEPAIAIAAVARLVVAAGLAEAFGHVSARRSGGFAITSTAPLGSAHADSILLVDGSNAPDSPRAGLPIEAPLHAAIYAARGDVDAIVRVHPPSLVVVGATGELPPICHGLGGLAGSLSASADAQLVDDRERAGAAATALGDSDCLVMRGNGALAVGSSLGEATVRAWFAEERARVWLDAGRPGGLGEDELELRARHWPAEQKRAWRWLRWRFGDEELV